MDVGIMASNFNVIHYWRIAVKNLFILFLFVFSTTLFAAESADRTRLHYLERDRDISRFLSNFLVSKVLVIGKWSEAEGKVVYPYYKFDEDCVDQAFARLQQLYPIKWRRLGFYCEAPAGDECTDGIKIRFEAEISTDLYRSALKCPASLIAEPKKFRLVKKTK